MLSSPLSFPLSWQHGGDHFPNLGQAKEFLADRSAHFLDKKALTFGWMQVPANGTEISLVLGGGGGGAELPFVFHLRRKPSF